MKLLSSLLAVLLVSSAALTSASAQEPPPLPSPEELEQLLTAFDVPGLSMATLTNCELDDTLIALGSASLEPNVAVTPLTVFEAASLSKPVFAYLVLTLVDEGVIELDKPIAETFDYTRIHDKNAYAEITPRMVLTHRTGLPNWVNEETDFDERTTPIPFEAQPGAAYSYSGEAFQLLQAFVETETDRTLQELFTERLGDVMPQSTFTAPLPDGLELSRGYQGASNPASGEDLDLEMRGAAAYSLVTTAQDYARFLSHVCKGEGLGPESYAEMLTPQSLLPEAEAPFPTSYGLGWLLADMGVGTLVGHGGNNDEYRAFAGFIRESGDGLVVLTNGATGQDLIDLLIAPPSAPDESLSPPERTFEAFWALYNEGYALFGVKHVDWDAVYRVYRPQVTAETTEEELWDLLEDVIDLLNDVHVILTDPATGRQVRSGGRSIGVGEFDNSEFSLDLIGEAYTADGLTSAAKEAIHFGWLSNNIGYLHIRTFADLEASEVAIDKVMAEFENAKGIVIDVRHNGGGDDHVGRVIASRFVAEPRFYMSVAMRKIGQSPSAFAKPVEWWLEPAGPEQYTGPLVLLVNSRSISAAENFALALRTVPHALIMGETTAGVMADVATQPLPNGWQAGVPINLFRDANGVSWEGIGVTPDLWVKNERIDIELGRDPVLETAIAFLDADAVWPRDREGQVPVGQK